MKKLKQGESLMLFKKFKTFAMCDIVLTVLFCIYSLSLFFKMTNTNIILIKCYGNIIHFYMLSFKKSGDVLSPL